MIWLPVVGDYVDVDAYASIIAYADLLRQRGKMAQTYIPFAPNYSVPADLRMMEYENRHFDLQPDDVAIILDVSVPEAIHKFVPNEQILELIDHHPGFEDYWRERIGERAIIEKIGAVATSIFEWWGECWNYDKMSPKIAKLLLAAILDNTLNFNAEITTERDRAAAKKLAAIAHTTVENFTGWYFTKVSEGIISDLENALTRDSKVVILPTDQSEVGFGQLALWSATEITEQRQNIRQVMQEKYKKWLVSIACIEAGKNYIMASELELQDYLVRLLDLNFENDWLVSDRLYLRKEIIKKMLA